MLGEGFFEEIILELGLAGSGKNVPEEGEAKSTKGDHKPESEERWTGDSQTMFWANRDHGRVCSRRITVLIVFSKDHCAAGGRV